MCFFLVFRFILYYNKSIYLVFMCTLTVHVFRYVWLLSVRTTPPMFKSWLRYRSLLTVVLKTKALFSRTMDLESMKWAEKSKWHIDLDLTCLRARKGIRIRMRTILLPNWKVSMLTWWCSILNHSSNNGIKFQPLSSEDATQRVQTILSHEAQLLYPGEEIKSTIVKKQD